MRQVDAGNVEGNGAFLFCNGENLRRRGIEYFSFRIDEAVDQPWTGDPVDLRAFADDP